MPGNSREQGGRGREGYTSVVRRKKQMERGWSIGQERARKIMEQITYRPKPAGSATSDGPFPPSPTQAPARCCSFEHRSVPLHTNSSILLLGNNVYHPPPPSAYLLPNSSKGKRPTGNTTTGPSSPPPRRRDKTLSRTHKTPRGSTSRQCDW